MQKKTFLANTERKSKHDLPQIKRYINQNMWLHDLAWIVEHAIKDNCGDSDVRYINIRHPGIAFKAFYNLSLKYEKNQMFKTLSVRDVLTDLFDFLRDLDGLHKMIENQNEVTPTSSIH